MTERRLPAVQWMSTPACGSSSSTRAAKHAAAVRRFAGEQGLELDAGAFADAWRSRYVPGMRRVSTGERPFVPLDVLHRENLDGVLEDLGLDPGRFGPAGSTNSTAPGTCCRPGPTASRGSPR